MLARDCLDRPPFWLQGDGLAVRDWERSQSTKRVDYWLSLREGEVLWGLYMQLGGKERMRVFKRLSRRGLPRTRKNIVSMMRCMPMFKDDIEALMWAARWGTAETADPQHRSVCWWGAP